MSAKKKMIKADIPVLDLDLFLEGLAQLEHEQWCHWAMNLIEDEKRITKARRERWETLIQANWEDIADEHKEMDYHFAQKVLAHFREDAFNNLIMVAEFILDSVYPGDVFVGGPDADVGVKFVVALREALGEVKKVMP